MDRIGLFIYFESDCRELVLASRCFLHIKGRQREVGKPTIKAFYSSLSHSIPHFSPKALRVEWWNSTLHFASLPEQRIENI